MSPLCQHRSKFRKFETVSRENILWFSRYDPSSDIQYSSDTGELLYIRDLPVAGPASGEYLKVEYDNGWSNGLPVQISTSREGPWYLFNKGLRI